MHSALVGGDGKSPVEEFCSLLRRFSKELEGVAASFASADIDQRFFLQMTEQELSAFDLSPNAITQLSVVREILLGWSCPTCTTRNSEGSKACTACDETNPDLLQQLAKDSGNRKIKRGTGNSRYNEGLYTFGTQMNGKKAELVLENRVKVEKPKAKLRKVRGRGASKYQKIKKQEEKLKKNLPVKPKDKAQDSHSQTISLSGLDAIREANNKRRKQRSVAVLKESIQFPSSTPASALDDFWASIRQKKREEPPQEKPRINPLLRSSSETRGEIYRAGRNNPSSKKLRPLSSSRCKKLIRTKKDSNLYSSRKKLSRLKVEGGMRSDNM